MNSEELRARQAPLKSRYREVPDSARITLLARGNLNPSTMSCLLEPARSREAGLHPLAGGEDHWACSGELLLDSLVACAGVTLLTVATALGIEVRGGTVVAEGDLDFRGTLGVNKEVPVGFQAIRLRFALESAATDGQRADLCRLTERYCVVFQTLNVPPALSVSLL